MTIKELLGHAQIHTTADVPLHLRLRLQCDAKPWTGHWTRTEGPRPAAPDRPADSGEADRAATDNQ